MNFYPYVPFTWFQTTSMCIFLFLAKLPASRRQGLFSASACALLLQEQLSKPLMTEWLMHTRCGTLGELLVQSQRLSFSEGFLTSHLSSLLHNQCTRRRDGQRWVCTMSLCRGHRHWTRDGCCPTRVTSWIETERLMLASHSCQTYFCPFRWQKEGNWGPPCDTEGKVVHRETEGAGSQAERQGDWEPPGANFHFCPSFPGHTLVSSLPSSPSLVPSLLKLVCFCCMQNKAKHTKIKQNQPKPLTHSLHDSFLGYRYNSLQRMRNKNLWAPPEPLKSSIKAHWLPGNWEAAAMHQLLYSVGQYFFAILSK